jgi:hypothetical protein
MNTFLIEEIEDRDLHAETDPGGGGFTVCYIFKTCYEVFWTQFCTYTKVCG